MAWDLASGLLALGAILALFALLFAPFTGWRPFAGPSALASSREHPPESPDA